MWSETWKNHVEQIRFYVVHSRLYPILTIKTAKMFQILGDVVMNSPSNHISPSKSASLMRGKTFRSQILCIVFLVWYLLILCHDDIFTHQEDWLPTHWMKTSKDLFFESMYREVCWFRLRTSGDLTHQFSRLIIWVVSLHSFSLQVEALPSRERGKHGTHQMGFSGKIIDSKWWYGLVWRRGRLRSPPPKS